MTVVTKCQRDCEYFSTYTDTCDYTLLMYESRGCPTSACTKYKPREGNRRSWNIFRAGPETSKCEEDEAMYKTSDGFESRYVIANCGHEVYDGERMYEWEDDDTLCPECVEMKFDELSILEKAALLCCESMEVNFPPCLM